MDVVAGVGNRGEQIVDVALPVADHRDHVGGAEPFRAVTGNVVPAPGFLVLECPVPPALHDLGRALPDLAAGEPDDAAVRRIDCEAGMNEEPQIAAVAGEAEPAAAAGVGLIVDLAAILDRQHVAAGNAARAVLRGRRQHLIRGHVRTIEKARVAHLARMSPAEPPEANGASRTHRRQQISAPFWRRRSPKCPSVPSWPASRRVMSTSANRSVVDLDRITRESRHANALC